MVSCQWSVVNEGREESTKYGVRRCGWRLDSSFILHPSSFIIHAPPRSLPGLDRGQQGVALLEVAPDRFSLPETNLVLSFPLALRRAAEMRQIRDPENAMDGYVLVVNQAKWHGRRKWGVRR